MLYRIGLEGDVRSYKSSARFWHIIVQSYKEEQLENVYNELKSNIGIKEEKDGFNKKGK